MRLREVGLERQRMPRLSCSAIQVGLRVIEAEPIAVAFDVRQPRVREREARVERDSLPIEQRSSRGESDRIPRRSPFRLIDGVLGFEEEVARAVSVDSRGIIEALKNVYKVDGLVKEITGK